jgi:hypothetical protein
MAFANTPNSSGLVIDIKSNEYIKGALISLESPTLDVISTSITDTEGSFTIQLPIDINQTGSDSLPKLIITKQGYETVEFVPYKGDGSSKENFVIQMNPIQSSLDEDKINSSLISQEEIDVRTKNKKDSKYYAQKKLNEVVVNMKSRLLPVVLTLIAEFGITKATQLIEKNKGKVYNLKNQISCPTPEELTKLIARKNKLVRQLNNTLKIIDNTTKILGISGNVILVLEISFKILKNLPLPTSVPPGVGVPTNVILGIQDSKDTIDKIITSLKATNAGILVTLVILRQILTQVLQHLSLLDELVQHCSPNTPQEQISAELTALTQQQSNQTSPVVTNINGFTMSVETEATDKPLKRRRALATNKGGVVMLKGEWSYSSIDQILIDELVFYIQTNDLKAE